MQKLLASLALCAYRLQSQIFSYYHTWDVALIRFPQESSYQEFEGHVNQIGISSDNLSLQHLWNSSWVLHHALPKFSNVSSLLYEGRPTLIECLNLVDRLDESVCVW